MENKKALIIGVSGQDGAYLAELLLSKGYEVYGTSRNCDVSNFDNLRKLKILDRIHLTCMIPSDFRSVLTLLQKIEVDEMYNLAGQTSVGMSFEYPVETFDSILIGTMNLLECIRLLKKPIKFFNAGSSECFGNTETPADEEAPFKPRSPYATAKAAAHFAVANYREAYGLFAATGILFNHESPIRPARFVTQKIITTALRIANGSGERLNLGDLSIYRDWGWAPEYVDAMWRILQCDTPEDFVIATGHMISLREFAETVFNTLGLNAVDHIDSNSTSLLRPSDITYSVGNPQKAYHKLSWKAHTQVDLVIKKIILEGYDDHLRKTHNPLSGSHH